jgi:hypothetical protein
MAGQDDMFQQILKASSIQLTEARRSAIDWIKDKIKNLRGDRRRPQSKVFQKSGLPEIGGMYLFEYDPKHKDKLPFWDTYPLVIPIHYYNDGFLGINLHYLPPNARIALLQELFQYTNNDKFDRTTRINVSYNMLKRFSVQLSGDNGILKRYLFGHVRSGFNQVAPGEWIQAASLPLQRWQQNSSPKLRKPTPY